MFTVLDEVYEGQERKFLMKVEELVLKLKKDTQRIDNGLFAHNIYYILDDDKYKKFFDDLKNLIDSHKNLWQDKLYLLKSALEAVSGWQPIYGYYGQHIVEIIKSNHLLSEQIFYNIPNPLDLTKEFFSYEPVSNSKLLVLKDTNGRTVPLHEQIFNRPGILLKIFEAYRPILMNLAYEREDVRTYLLSRKIEGLYKAATDYCYREFNEADKYTIEQKDFMFAFAQKIDPQDRSTLKEALKNKFVSWHSDLEMARQKGFQNLAPEFNPYEPSGDTKFSNIVFKNLIFPEEDILNFLKEFFDLDKKQSYRAVIDRKMDETAKDINAKIIVDERDLEKIIFNYPNSNHNAVVAQEMFNYCWEMQNYKSCQHISEAVEPINFQFSFKQYSQALKSLLLPGVHDDYFYEHLNALASSAKDARWQGYSGVLDLCFDSCVQRRRELDDKFRNSHEPVNTKITGRRNKIDQNKLDYIFEKIDCKTIMPLVVCLFASKPEHLKRILEHNAGQYTLEDLSTAFDVIKEIINLNDYFFLEKNLLEAHIQINTKIEPKLLGLHSSFKI